jgi:hypothetical protein
MIMPLQQPPSPLDNIPNLEVVPPEKVKALEEHLERTVRPKVVAYLISQHKAAIAMRKKGLF